MGRKSKKRHILARHFPSIYSRSALDLLPHLANMVLVAIDTENTNMGSKRSGQQCQIGLAVLDLADSSRTIKSANFVCGPPSYCKKKMPRFLFGESTRVHSLEVKEAVEAMVPPMRDVILIGHAVHAELCCLVAFEVHIPLQAVVDTQRLAQRIWPRQGYELSLGRLSDKLGFSATYKHIAGNDAFFTLTAFLGLVSRSSPPGEPSIWDEIATCFEEARQQIKDNTVPLERRLRRCRWLEEKLTPEWRANRHAVNAARAARRNANIDCELYLANTFIDFEMLPQVSSELPPEMLSEVPSLSNGWLLSSHDLHSDHADEEELSWCFENMFSV